jgi:hypothetical protein
MQLGRASLRKEFTGGDLEATGTVEMLSARQGESAGTYVALELINGRLGELVGTFLLQHGGTASSDGGQRTWVEVVEGSGTGELVGLRGQGRIEHGLLELDYGLAS